MAAKLIKTFSAFYETRTCNAMFTTTYCWRMLLEQHPSHRTHNPCRRTPGLRQTTIWGHYTTCCKSHSCAPEDGQELPQTYWANL